jgi:D-aminoacyl-tRNA deacylase
MRAVLQRVRQARVEVTGKVTGSVGAGIVVLLGIARSDTETDADYLVDKVLGLRIFPDDNGKMNRSVKDVGGGLLVVSQFTLYGDTSRGRRPSFDDAAPAGQAQVLYEYFVHRAKQLGMTVETGVFQAMMTVYIENDGPVTLICDTTAKK